MGSNLTCYENRCEIKGREDQHDPMYFHCKWKGWTRTQRVLQSSHSKEPRLQLSNVRQSSSSSYTRRPQLAMGEVINRAVPYKDNSADKDYDNYGRGNDNDDDQNRGASEHEQEDRE